MAEAMVVAVMSNLGSLAVGKLMAKAKFVKEYGLLVGVQHGAQKLLPKLILIKAVLQDAEMKQIRQRVVKEWMEALKQIMYEADDVLDEWDTRVSIFQSRFTTDGSTFRSMLFSCLSSENCSCFNPLLPIISSNNYRVLVFRIDIARRIEGITARLDELSANMQQLNLISNPATEDNTRPPRQLTSSMVDVSEVYDRDDDKKVIVSWLLSESSEKQKEVPVISIVGTGGFGKTTLAKLILEDVGIATTFGKKNIWWVCVSEPFDRERVAREIIEQATGTKPDVGALQVLLQRLVESVKGKRFLLVLDDVWSRDQNDWDALKIALTGGERGSRIIITTRDLRVAKMMGSTSSHTHMIGELSDDGCWSIFRSIAFWGRPQDEIVRLDEIGQALVKKCKGVPLAVKTLASHMRWERTIRDWKNVLNNEIWKVQHGTFFPALLLSYHTLPSSLKQCFMYCSVFPKDSVIKTDELVKLWMAQGFLESDGREELEMVGAEYFSDLATASFFQDFEKDNAGGSIVSCKMHDLVHDFSQFLSGKECLVTDANPREEVCNEQVRHMNVSGVDHSCIYKAKNLRTLISKASQSIPYEIFHQLTCLRSLNLSGSKIKELPSRVGSLLHLRYLDVSYSILEELPQTMCNLYNLQTLKLFECLELRTLPEEIGMLSNLRHLDIRGTCNLSYIPHSIGRLSHLRTLSKFIVSERSKIGELGSLNLLSGILELLCLRSVGSFDEAKRADLKKKKNLGHLQFDFGCHSDEVFWGLLDEDHEAGVKRMEGVLEGLQPDANLEELAIKSYPGSTFPFWMSRESLLPNLLKLELKNCMNCSLLPPLGNLEYLESLHIQFLGSVKYITSEFYGVGVEISFPKLKKLHFSGMGGWEQWEIPFSKFKKVLPRLCYLELSTCPKLMELPALGRLESLERIEIKGLYSVKLVSAEFLGGSCHSGEEQTVSRLTELSFGGMPEWEEWTLPLVLPNLSSLFLWGCPKLKPLSASVSKLQTLESLTVSGLKKVKNVCDDILGISDSNSVFAATRDGKSLEPDLPSSAVPIFPKLTSLRLANLPEWEEEQICEDIEITADTIMLAGLRELCIQDCEKLKVVPHYMFSHSLRKIRLENCPQLIGTQPCLPPLLEELSFWHDIGVLSKSILPIITHGNNNDGNSYPNLNLVIIWYSPHSSLPQGLNKFISLKQLRIYECEFLDLKLEELRYIPMLQEVHIGNCPTIRERCNREDWGNQLSQQITFKIFMDFKDITVTE